MTIPGTQEFRYGLYRNSFATYNRVSVAKISIYGYSIGYVFHCNYSGIN